MGPTIEYFRNILSNVFDIREGEHRRAFLMQLNIFLIISTLLIVKPAVNGMFLSKFGAENLPNAFVLVAIFAGLVSILYTRVLVRIPLNIIIVRTHTWSIITLIVFGLLLRLNVLEGWVLYLFYIWVAIFAVLSASQFWVLANVVFNAREAKRLFGFIGAGAIAGGIFGGYLTSVTAELVGSENLLFIAALLLLFCIPITQRIWKKEVLPLQSKFVRKKRMKRFDSNPIALIRKSKHLTYLAAIIGTGVIVAKLVEYQFSAIASEQIPDPDDLTAFFGFWFSNFNVISLIVQLFLTRKVVGVYGVGTSLFFLPLGIMLGAILVFIFPELWAVIFIRLMDGSLKQSVNKSAIELMAMPIPLDIKNQTKSFIDIFIDSAATGIGGLILIFLVTGFDLSTRFISLMILALILLWIYFARKIRMEYLRSFKLKIEQVREDSEKKSPAFNLSNESVLMGLRKVLKQGSEKQVAFVLHKIKESPDERLFYDVGALLDHLSPVVRSEALQCLYFFRGNQFTDKVLTMVTDPDQLVKTAAFDYLVAHIPEKKTELLKKFLQDKDYRVRGAALVSLAAETRNNPELKRKFDVEGRIAKKISTLENLKDEDEIRYRKKILLRSIAKANLTAYFWFIAELMNDDDPEIVMQAIESAGLTFSGEFIKPLSGFLNQDPYKGTAKSALQNYGPALLDGLEEVVQKDQWNIEVMRHIPSIIEHFGLQQSVELLFQMIDHPDFGLRMEALRSLNVVKSKHPNLRFHKKEVIRRILDEAHLYLETLTALYTQTRAKTTEESKVATGLPEKLFEARTSLIDLLERRLDGNLERIFWLLGLRYPSEDMLNVYQGIQSKKPEMRINALEFLDNLLETNLKRVLIPIVETVLLENISEEVIKNLNLKVPDEYQCFSMLLAGKDVKIILAVLYLIAQQKNKRYIHLVSTYTQSRNQKIKTFAKQTLHELLKT